MGTPGAIGSTVVGMAVGIALVLVGIYLIRREGRRP